MSCKDPSQEGRKRAATRLAESVELTSDRSAAREQT